MLVDATTADRALDLPPPYDVIALREGGEAFTHACAIARQRGAGTLVWVRRYDLAEFAVVLEPETPFAEARRAFIVGMNALADALATHAPPGRGIAIDWPDAIRVDDALVGGGRLGWPDGVRERDVPPWLVFSAMLRTFALRAGEPGARPLLGALDEAGFQDIDAGEIIASFARHFLAGFHEWRETGFAAAAERWLGRLRHDEGKRMGPAEDRDLLLFQGAGSSPPKRRRMIRALAAPSWLDPTTGMPWL